MYRKGPIRQQWRVWHLLPLLGFIAFIVLYVIAACWYPGGSQINKASHGYSWTQNYWCNLLSEYAINGRPNPARLIAFPAMAILCVSLVSFWVRLFEFSSFSKTGKLFLKTCAVLSMAVSFFIFTSWHDAVINVAGFFGLIVLAAMQTILYRKKWYFLFGFGVFNLVLIALNNILYHNHHLYYLPVVQKATFISFLTWISFIIMAMTKKLRLIMIQ